jgi:DNA-binding transcriptional ArsR family regulator
MNKVIPVADLVSFHKALASRSRLRILSLLARRSLCVNALARSLGISQPAVSQHLEVLKAARLVAGERMGTMVHYRLDRERVKLVDASTARLLGRSPDTIHTCGEAGDVSSRAEGRSK